MIIVDGGGADTLGRRGSISLAAPVTSSPAPPAFNPLDLSPALWIDPSDTSTVTISGSSGSYIGANGLLCPGGVTNYASAPSIAAYVITGSIDVIVKAAATNWTPAAYLYLASRRHGSAGWGFWIEPGTGKLGFTISGVADYTSTVGTGFSAGSTNWVRVTRDGTTGDVVFYTSADGSTWIQLGSTVAGSTANMGDPANALNIGLSTATFPFVGTIMRAIVKNGIAGTTVFDADFVAANNYAMSFVESSSNAATVTVTSSTNGAAVSQINDKSGNARNLSQATLANMPALQYDAVSGRTMLVFDGVNDALQSASFTMPTDGGAFFTLKLPAAAGSYRYLMVPGTASGDKRWAFLLDNAAPMHLWRWNTYDGGALTAADRLNIAYSLGGTTEQFSYDGTPVTARTGAIPGVAAAVLNVGGAHSDGVFYFSGQMMELLIMPTTPTAGQLASMQTYEQARWNT